MGMDGLLKRHRAVLKVIGEELCERKSQEEHYCGMLRKQFLLDVKEIGRLRASLDSVTRERDAALYRVCVLEEDLYELGVGDQ